MPVLTALQLPFEFGAATPGADLARVLPDEWVPHYNDRDFGGRWAGVSLRSPSGRTDDLGVTGSTFSDSPLLARSPAFSRVLSVFRCPLKAVRLLSLAPGSFIREHCDNALDFEDGEVRIHIPLQTNPDVEFYLNGERLGLEAGQCYYVNVNLPHRVNNRGTTNRVHLVIDSEVNDWLREVFARSEPVPRIPAPQLGIDQFRKIVVTNRKLSAIRDRRELLAEATREATALGFGFHEADLEAAARAASTEFPDDRTGWIPFHLEFPAGSAPLAEWIYAPGERLTEPFFEDSIRKFRWHPLTNLTRCKAPLPAAIGAPAGMIFHLSRCGSTLVAKSFAALPHTTVLSEPPPFDQILQSAGSDEEKIAWLRSFVGAFAGRSKILKLDAWHMPHLRLIRQAFPQTPWIFLFRHPLEVLASHLRQPGLHMIPPPENRLSRVDFAAGVLAGILRAALDARSEPGGLFVDYTELPQAITGKIAAHFGMPLSEADYLLIREASQVDAKRPSNTFVPDTEAKRQAALEYEHIPAVRELVSLYVGLRKDCES
jgi:mannose-6-phosphate isomerase-like protein (cupin superfamily)